jgi:hypothetical protein
VCGLPLPVAFDISIFDDALADWPARWTRFFGDPKAYMFTLMPPSTKIVCPVM